MSLVAFMVAFFDDFSFVRWYVDAFVHAHRWNLFRLHGVGHQNTGPFAGEFPVAVLVDEFHVIGGLNFAFRQRIGHGRQSGALSVTRQDWIDDVEFSTGFCLRSGHGVEQFWELFAAFDGVDALFCWQVRISRAL